MKRLTVVLVLALVFMLLANAAAADVVRITVDDMIHPISDEYIGRAIDFAASRHADALLIELRTPGGLADSMRSIVEKIIKSPVPVIVYVAPAGSAFTIFAIGFAAMPLYAIRRSRADAEALQQGVIVDRGGATGVTLLIFAIIWNAIAFPIGFMIPRGQDVPGWAFALAMLFPAIGVFLLIAAAYQLLRRHKYGASRLMLDHLPVATGTTFRGDIDTHMQEAPESGFALRLMCVRRVVTGSGKSRTTREDVLWADEQTVGSGSAMRNPLGTRIPFTFTIPDDARPTDERNSSDSILWRIAVKASVPGVDYAAGFQFPVVSTGEHPHVPREFAVAATSATSWVPSPESHIAITPLPEGGEEIVVATHSRPSEIFGMLVFAAIWYGFVVLMIAVHAPLLFPILFSLFGLVVVFAILDGLFGRSIIRASRTSLTLRRTSPFALGTTRTIDPSQIETVSSNLALATQSAASMYTVDVTLTSGEHVQAAKAIRERSDAEMLAARIRGICLI